MSRGVIASLLLHVLVLAPLLFMFAPPLDSPVRESMQTRFVAHTVNIEALRPDLPEPIQPRTPPKTETLKPLISESERARAVTPLQPETVEPSRPEPDPKTAKVLEPPPEPERKPLPEPKEAEEPEQVAQAEPEPVEPEPQPEPEPVKPRPEPKEPVKTEPVPEPPPEEALAPEEPPPKPQPPIPQEQVATLHEAPAASPSSPSEAPDAAVEGGGGTAPDPSYLMEIRALLEAHKTYPAMAQRLGMEGDVYLWFVISRQGRVLDYRIDKGSGHEMLDEEVKRLIRDISQFPPVPSEVGADQLELVVPVSFRLAG